jgi:hypothetical protein
MSAHVYANAEMGELAFLMKQNHRERADVMGSNLLCFFWSKRRERSWAWVEVRAMDKSQKKLKILMIKSGTTTEIIK